MWEKKEMKKKIMEKKTTQKVINDKNKIKKIKERVR